MDLEGDGVDEYFPLSDGLEDDGLVDELEPDENLGPELEEDDGLVDELEPDENLGPELEEDDLELEYEEERELKLLLAKTVETKRAATINAVIATDL